MTHGHLVPTRRRRRDRGQMVPLAAVMGMVILGGSALAFDITVNTHARRSVQNVVDSAALAGAQDLLEPNISSNTSSMLQAARQTATATVFKSLHTSLGFSVNNPNYASQAVQAGNCANNGSVCDVDNAVFGNYTISVDSPPTTAGQYGNAGYNGDAHYLEVTLRQLSRNSLGGVVGSPTSIEGGHAVAYHFGAGQQFGFALYTNTVVTDGNDTEIVTGNVYAYRNINPSSSGHASFCAAQLSDGTQGNIVLGSPQWPDTADIPNPDPAGGALQQYVLAPNGHDPDTVLSTTDCSTVQSGQVAQTGTDETGASPHCPTAVQGVTLGSGSYMDINSSNASQYTHACVAVPAVQEPFFSGPVSDTGPTSATCPTTPGNGGSYQPGYWQCSANNQPTIHIDHPLTPGIYHIAHNPNCTLPQCADVTVDQASGTVAAGSGATNCPTGGIDVMLCSVTFWLDSNATINFGSGERVAITPYMPQPVSRAVFNDGKFPVYAPYGTSGQVVSVTNISTVVGMSGTLYLPGGTMSVGDNAFVLIQGQAIVNEWDVKSGAHLNPDIQYDAGRMASLNEILRIVE